MDTTTEQAEKAYPLKGYTDARNGCLTEEITRHGKMRKAFSFPSLCSLGTLKIQLARRFKSFQSLYCLHPA